jgi:hypothetical protein
VPRTAPSFDVLDVLTRAGDERDALLAMLDDPAADIDSHLVSDVLRSTGRVGAALETRPALVELCAVLRAIDAATSGRIALTELRSGIEVHAARTDRFAAFHDARVLLRTLDELLADPARLELDERATRSQVALLHRELQAWMEDELLGSAAAGLADPAPGSASTSDAPADPRAAFAITDPVERRAAHDAVDELLHGARHHPVTGLLGAAWMRDWSAVPVAGERIGEDAGELERILEAVRVLGPVVTHVLMVDRRAQPRWHVEGRTVVVGDGLRLAWRLPATADGLRHLALEDRARCVLTTPDLAFAIVEAVDHHAVLGPAAFVEAACDATPLQAIARFREYVEDLAEDTDSSGVGEPPEHLVEVATSFGRLRRRSR